MTAVVDVPGVESGRWTYPTLSNEAAAHRLYSSAAVADSPWGHDPVIRLALSRRGNRVRVALCGTTAGGWQDVATCPPGAATFDDCEPCADELRRLIDADVRARTQPEPPPEPPPAPERTSVAVPWRPAGFSSSPATGAGR